MNSNNGLFNKLNRITHRQKEKTIYVIYIFLLLIKINKSTPNKYLYLLPRVNDKENININESVKDVLLQSSEEIGLKAFSQAFAQIDTKQLTELITLVSELDVESNNIFVELKKFLDTSKRSLNSPFLNSDLTIIFQGLIQHFTHKTLISSVFDFQSRYGEVIDQFISNTNSQSQPTFAYVDNEAINNDLTKLLLTTEHNNAIIKEITLQESKQKSFDCIISSSNFTDLNTDTHKSFLNELNNYTPLKNLKKQSSVFTEEALWLPFLSDLLSANGFMLVLTKESFLYRKGVDEEVRRTLLKDNWVEGIIALPKSLFYRSQTDRNLLIINKNRSIDEPILMANYREANINTTSFVELLCQSLNDRKTSSDNNIVRTVNLREVEALNWSLRPIDYIQINNQTNQKTTKELAKELELVEENYNQTLQSWKDSMDILAMQKREAGIVEIFDEAQQEDASRSIQTL